MFSTVRGLQLVPLAHRADEGAKRLQEFLQLKQAQAQAEHSLSAVEPLSGVGPWGRPRVIGDPYK